MEYFASAALLPDGWQSDVLIRVSARGDILDVTPHSAPGDATRLAGAVVPGVPNVHSHAHQRAIAGLSERSGPADDNFWTWRDVMYRFAERLTPDALEAIAAQLYLEMLQAGYTAVAEFHYLHHASGGARYENLAEMSLRIAAAAADTGIGLTQLPVLYCYAGFGEVPAGPTQRRFVCDFDSWARIHATLADASRDNANFALGVAAHSLRAVSPELLEKLVAHAQAQHPATPIHVHIAEQLKEVEECLSAYAQRPVAWLLERYPVDAHWCLVHATHLSEREISDLARTQAVVGLCPTTEANLGDGLFPARSFLAQAGQFAIGSDSHISVSPSGELRLLEYGQRLTARARNLLTRGPERSTGRDLFDAVLHGGSQACGRKIGRLEPGFRADFIALDTEHPALAARSGDALLDTWIFGTDLAVVRHVVVGGQWLIRDGQHPNQQRIHAHFKHTLRTLFD